MSIKDVIESWDEEERRLDREHLAMKNWNAGFSCSKCKHLDKNGVSCAAFPDVIPEDIIAGVFDHRKPFPGDHGILFEPKE